MATDDRKKLGELVVVVIRARHLTNIKMSKQDPYCSLMIGTDKRRTAAIKKGGQHPEWDEQVKFDIYEDMADQLARTKDEQAEDSLGASASSRREKRKMVDKGAKTMTVKCYADAPREPELIGEAAFDLAKALNSGEDEDWITINRKDRYAGEIFIEFTYFIAGAPPPPKPPKPLPGGSAYGGPGRFEPSTSSTSTIRQSSSVASIQNLYIPPYAPQGLAAPGMNGGVGSAGMVDPRTRRESFGGAPGVPHSASYYSAPSSRLSMGDMPRPASMMSLNSASTGRPLPTTTEHPSYGHPQRQGSGGSIAPSSSMPWLQASTAPQQPPSQLYAPQPQPQQQQYQPPLPPRSPAPQHAPPFGSSYTQPNLATSSSFSSATPAPQDYPTGYQPEGYGQQQPYAPYQQQQQQQQQPHPHPPPFHHHSNSAPPDTTTFSSHQPQPSYLQPSPSTHYAPPPEPQPQQPSYGYPSSAQSSTPAPPQLAPSPSQYLSTPSHDGASSLVPHRRPGSAMGGDAGGGRPLPDPRRQSSVPIPPQPSYGGYQQPPPAPTSFYDNQAQSNGGGYPAQQSYAPSAVPWQQQQQQQPPSPPHDSYSPYQPPAPASQSSYSSYAPVSTPSPYAPPTPSPYAPPAPPASPYAPVQTGGYDQPQPGATYSYQAPLAPPTHSVGWRQPSPAPPPPPPPPPPSTTHSGWQQGGYRQPSPAPPPPPPPPVQVGGGQQVPWAQQTQPQYQGGYQTGWAQGQGGGW